MHVSVYIVGSFLLLCYSPLRSYYCVIARSVIAHTDCTHSWHIEIQQYIYVVHSNTAN